MYMCVYKYLRTYVCMYTYILYVCTCIGCRQRVVSVSAYTCAQRPFHAHVSAVPRYDMHAGMYVTTTRKEKEKLLLYVAGLQGPLPYTLRTHTHLWHTYAIHTHTHSACTRNTHINIRQRVLRPFMPPMHTRTNTHTTCDLAWVCLWCLIWQLMKKPLTNAYINIL